MVMVVTQCKYVGCRSFIPRTKENVNMQESSLVVIDGVIWCQKGSPFAENLEHVALLYHIFANLQQSWNIWLIFLILQKILIVVG
jgi:hypothetical protein